MQNLSNAAYKSIEKIFDEMDDRRLNGERMQAAFAGHHQASFHPLYDAEDVDDGRLDRSCSTGFVSIDQIPDHTEPYELADEDFDTDVDTAPALELPPEPACPHGPRSNRKYADEYKAMLPPIRNVYAIRRGYGLVPYAEARKHPGFIRLCKQAQ